MSIENDGLHSQTQNMKCLYNAIYFLQTVFNVKIIFCMISDFEHNGRKHFPIPRMHPRIHIDM